MALGEGSEERLRELAAKYPAALVFYSGGKESLVVTDLAVRHWKTVVLVHMYFVPGLEITQRRLDYAKARWGLDCLLLPHWLIGRFLRRGVYCIPQPKIDEMNVVEMHNLARAETGIDLVLTGHRSGDGNGARRAMKWMARPDLYQPLKNWSKLDVLAYMKANQIERIDTIDLDLSTHTLLTLHDHHPDDFKRVCEVYPHAEAVVFRRDRWGIVGKVKVG